MWTWSETTPISKGLLYACRWIISALSAIKGAFRTGNGSYRHFQGRNERPDRHGSRARGAEAVHQLLWSGEARTWDEHKAEAWHSEVIKNGSVVCLSLPWGSLLLWLTSKYFQQESKVFDWAKKMNVLFIHFVPYNLSCWRNWQISYFHRSFLASSVWALRGKPRRETSRGIGCAVFTCDLI